MPLSEKVRDEIYDYCQKHLADEEWYETKFEFIQDEMLRKRLIEEYKAIRFAYKLYEGIGAENENLIFEIRYQIFAYASLYEAVLHYVLYTYYADTQEFHKLQYHNMPARIDIPTEQLALLNSALIHNGESIIPYHIQERKKDDSQVRFDDKCKTAEKLGIIHKFKDKYGADVDFSSELIEIYSYRNAIHLVAEQRKGITYELELSKKAYRRMQPFIEQVQEKLKSDKKSIYIET